ncbi:MAG: hypothetical protein ABFD76_02655 [Smithella sp.]
MGNDLIEEKECEEHLECILTGVELIDRSKKLAKANNDSADLESKKKDVVADFAAQLKKIEGSIGVFSRVVSSGKEYRTVKCIWRLNYTKKMKELIRLDTNDTVRTVELTKQELQTKLQGT